MQTYLGDRSSSTRTLRVTGACALAAASGLLGACGMFGASRPPEPPPATQVAAAPASATTPAPAATSSTMTFDPPRQTTGNGALASLGAAGADEASDAAENLVRATFSADGADFDPDVSRDGKWLVFASTQHRANASLYLKSVSGKTTTQLTNDDSNHVMPSFSPDGTRVAFASNRAGSWDIYVIGTAGGQPIQITSDASHELHPTWSPDGSQLAFCRLNPGSGRWEIWSISAANPGTARFLTHGMLPEWSPTGDTIAFQRSRERGDRLYSVWTIDLVDNEAVNPTEIASSTELAFVNPCWSPDGSRLAFAAVPASEVKGPVIGGLGVIPAESSIWMVNADGSGRTRLTGGKFIDVMPHWGNDGRIYFVSNRSGAENVWALTPGRAISTASFDGPAKLNRKSETAQGGKTAGTGKAQASKAQPHPGKAAAGAAAGKTAGHAEDPSATAHAKSQPTPMFLDPKAGEKPAEQPADSMANAPGKSEEPAGHDEPEQN